MVRGITKFQDGRGMVLVTNFREESQYLTKGIAVGHIDELENSAVIAALSVESTSLQHEITPPLERDIDPKFSAP